MPFIFGGSGMALVFAPSANAVLASVRTDQAGQASGATNAIRELGGVLGIAVLSTVFTSHGSYASPQAYVSGLHAGDVGRRRGPRGRRADGAGAAVQHARRRPQTIATRRRRPACPPASGGVGSEA